MTAVTFWTCAVSLFVVLQIVALRRIRRSGRSFVVTAAAITAVWLVAVFVIRSSLGGLPTFVDGVRNGAIPAESVQCIQIIEEGAANGRENVLAEVEDRTEVAECMSAFAKSTVGVKGRNHPQSLYRGALRVKMRHGTSNLIPFFVMRYEGRDFAYFYSFHGEDYAWDQNCYESTDIVAFLRERDPRFPK